ncbi:TMV resistance protein N [Prunus persica]|uniref:TMV resistance protein N n=1 Tax=Prunus persica TaxID=3760 RepID=UPI0009AB4ED8|nr:TMV resistance protein N [Prunus persica]
MSAVVDVWMSELAKLKDKVGAKKRLVFSSKGKQGEGDDEVEEPQQVLKEARKESSRMAETQRDLDSSTLSEPTVRLLMERFVPCRETEFIQNIVNEISLQVLNDTHINVAKYQVGIEARVQDLHKVLDVDGNDVRMVGIWGNGGIGKTTLAKAVYNSLAHMFEGSCFLENVRERSIPYGGLVDLQNLLLYEILRGKEIRVTSADKGINVIKERLSRKKVLLIVDDVDHLDQSNNLVGGCDWFGLGSRIIITTREHLLTCHRVSIIYEAKKLNYHESLDLFFSWNGFTRTRNLDDDYVELAEFVVDYAGGLPLALKVLGSHPCGRSIDVWHDALDGALHSDIQKTLKISYDALEDLVKEVFLDIACFFKGKDMNNVISILEGCDLKPKHAIEVLVEKALIYIEQNKIWMHDLLEELGRGIVHQESPNELGERSRVWFHEDVHRVLTEGTVSVCVCVYT